MDVIRQAIQLMENNQSDEAIEQLESYIPQANDEALLNIAELYMQWGFLENAITLLKKLINKFPEEQSLKIVLAECLIDCERDEEAIDILHRIDQNDPHYLQALLQMADLYQAEGLYEVAEMKLLEAKKIDVKEPIIDYALGEFYFSLGDYSRALLYYEKIVDKEISISKTLLEQRLAESYAAIGHYEKALSFFSRINSEQPEIVFKHGLTAFQADRVDVAIQLWERVIELDESYTPVYYELAKVYREMEDWQKVYDISQKGLSVNAYDKKLYVLASQASKQLDKYFESLTLAYEAVHLDPDYKEAVLLLAEILFDLEAYELVIEKITKAKENGAMDPMYDWKLAEAYVEMESYEKAARAYENAYHGLANNPKFLKEYGFFLLEEGEINKASHVLKDYLNYEPSDIEVIEHLERLSGGM